MNGLMSAGLPIYQNAHGQYLYYWGSDSNWRIGSDWTTAAGGVSSDSNLKTCPTDTLDWGLYYDSGWYSADVSLRCVEGDSFTRF